MKPKTKVKKKKVPAVAVAQRVLWTGLEYSVLEGRIVKLTSTVDGYLADLIVTFDSPLTGNPQEYHVYASPYRRKSERNSWRPYPKDE